MRHSISEQDVGRLAKNRKALGTEYENVPLTGLTRLTIPQTEKDVSRIDQAAGESAYFVVAKRYTIGTGRQQEVAERLD